MNLQPHQERVVAEKAELDKKLEALAAFIASPKFHDVDPMEQTRLNRQHGAMQEYSTILGWRIAAF